MHQTLVVLFIVLTLAWAQTPFQDCGKCIRSYNKYITLILLGSSGVSIESINVPGCTDFPCQLKRGQNASLSITFIASK